MGSVAEWFRKLTFLLKRNQFDRELEEEMRLHLELKMRKNLDSGMSAEEAHYAAQRQLGNFTRMEEESRQSWGFPFLESLLQDIRYGLRGLRKAPGFAVVATLTLALGIGAATCIFSIVNAVLLRPLPYQDASRMVYLWTVTPLFSEFKMGQSIPNLNDIKARSHSFDQITAFNTDTRNLTGEGDPKRVSVAAVSANFISFFAVHPILGRDLQPEDAQRKSGNVVVISYSLWQERFGAKDDVVGRAITLDGQAYTVAGVLPRGFEFPDKTLAWIPLVPTAEQTNDRSRWWYLSLAKLRPGVSLEQAQSEMDSIAAGLSREYPKDAEGIHFPVMTLQQSVIGVESKSPLLVLLAAVGFLLLIACANVSNLMLSRGMERQREIALRAALGASRRRILRQLLMESLLLALIGGLAGVGLAITGISVFRALAPPDFPRMEELRPELLIALFAFAISALAGILCGLAPALSTSRFDLNATMREKNSAVTDSRRAFSLRGTLVVAEIALALILLTGSALMVQGLSRLLKFETGLRIDNLVTTDLVLTKSRYSSEDSQRIFARQLLDSLHARPEFSGAALSNNSVLAGLTSLMSIDASVFGARAEKINLESRSVSAGFFEALGIRLIRGRFFDDHDAKGTPNVVIVNESLARRFFSDQDPIGRIFKLYADDKEQYQIVGVVAETRDIRLGGDRRLQIYFPILQQPGGVVYATVRSALDPAAVASLLKTCVWAVDREQPLGRVRSVADVVHASVAEPRFRSRLVMVFALSGLILSLIGIYGVISYGVTRRTHEMGIRMALGAQPGNVRGLILRDAVRLALIGAGIGAAGSLMLLRLLANQLYGIKANDPATLIGAALLMLIVAVAASYIPARRATKIDPVIALRCE